LTDFQKDKEEEVVQIINQFCKGVLDVNMPIFMPQQKLKEKESTVNVDEVVDIIKEDC
jgi:hypothetical protein